MYYDFQKLKEDFYTILEGIVKDKPIIYTNVDKNGNEYNN